MTKYFKEFKVYFYPFEIDLVTSFLWNLKPEGILEENNFVLVYFNENCSTTKEDIEMELLYLKELKIIKEFSVEFSINENKNWNEEWEKNLNIIKVGERIVIRPTSKNYQPEKDEIVLNIDPKMSFGTGEHETTKLVIKLLEKYVTPGIAVLDVGTGTGILVIAAVKLGAGYGIGIDNDEVCYENGIENCIKNNLSDKIEIRTGTIEDIKQNDFDIVIANIHKNVLIDISKKLIGKTKHNGLIILSGLLIADEKEIVEFYLQKDCELVETIYMNEWCAIVFRKIV